MGMGYGANYADVIKDKDVKKLCPKEYKAFETAIQKDGQDFEAVANALNFDDEIASTIKKAYKALLAAFKKVTKLDLALCYHDPENGDRYDEIQGSFWCITGGAWVLSPAGKKYEKYINRSFYVTYG